MGYDCDAFEHVPHTKTAAVPKNGGLRFPTLTSSWGHRAWGLHIHDQGGQIDHRL